MAPDRTYATHGSGTPPPPVTGGYDKANVVESVSRPLEQAQVGEQPANLPDKGDGGVGDREMTVEEIKEEIESLEESLEVKEFKEYIAWLTDIWLHPKGFHTAQDVSDAEDDLSNIYREIARQDKDPNFVRQQDNHPDISVQDVKDRIVELGGDFTPKNLEDMGDSEVLLYQAAVTQQNLFADNRWQIGPNHLQFHSLLPNGILGNSVTFGSVYDIWTRMKISVIDGSLGRSGFAFSGQLGVVRSLSDTVDGGVFISLFHGDMDFDLFATDFDTVGYGVGGYLKFKLSDILRGGISTSYQYSENDINIGGARGSFDSGRFTLDASLSGFFMMGETRVVPSANLSWLRTDRDAYIDSAAMFVPGSVDDVVTATGALNFSRVFQSGSEKISTIRPNIGVAVNFHLDQLDDIAFATGSRIETSSVTGSVLSGLTIHLVSGSSVNLTAGVNGIGGDTQSYSGIFRLSTPLQ